MNFKNLQILPSARRVMEKDALAQFPDECCGFFFGHEGKNREVVEVSPVNNSKEGDKRRRFKISPLDYLRAEQYAANNNLKLLGVYHSHPKHPAQPSEHDRIQAMPWFSYIILSVYDDGIKDVNSFQLNDERNFESETIIN